jgi:hypothetical protein
MALWIFAPERYGQRTTKAIFDEQVSGEDYDFSRNRRAVVLARHLAEPLISRECGCTRRSPEPIQSRRALVHNARVGQQCTPRSNRRTPQAKRERLLPNHPKTHP